MGMKQLQKDLQISFLCYGFPITKPVCVRIRNCREKSDTLLSQALHAINWKLSENKYTYYMTLAII